MTIGWDLCNAGASEYGQGCMGVCVYWTYHADLLIWSQLSQEVDVSHFAIVADHIPPKGCKHRQVRTTQT